MAKSSIKEIALYTSKINHYFEQLNRVNLISVTDTALRHGSIRSQLLIMDGIMNLLSSISPKLKRDRWNYYSELRHFEKVMKNYRFYVRNFDADDIEEEGYRQQEHDMQLRLMNKISTYEDFIDKELAYEPPKVKETDKIDIQGGVSLSLADMKMI